jgi:hypothetical protein
LKRRTGSVSCRVGGHHLGNDEVAFPSSDLLDSTVTQLYGESVLSSRSSFREYTVDVQRFQTNRQRFAPEELAKYAGQYVAWSPDGTSILASHTDELQLARAIQTAGYNSAEVLIAFVPAEDEILLGGGMEVIE